MRKTLTAATLLAAAVGGIVASAGVASAEEPAVDLDPAASTERQLPLIDTLPVVGPLLTNLTGNLGGGTTGTPLGGL